MGVNKGFVSSPGGRRTSVDWALDDGTVASVLCGTCQQPVPAGTAHIVTSPYGPDLHVMYCPQHCPCRLKRRRRRD